MKKLYLFLGIPVILLCFMIIFSKNFAFNLAKFSLAVQNPAQTIDYITKDNGNDNSSLPAEETMPPENQYNPFENFDINANAVPEPAPIDTEHPIIERTYKPVLNVNTYQRQNCYIKNLTELSRGDVEAELLAEPAFKVEKNSSEPQILIMHTHATESYQNFPELYYEPDYSCRNTDISKNMVSVGKIISETLNNLGYNTLHDATLHDYPSYTASYGRSKKTVEEYLAKYPSIKVVLDVHRDAIEKSDGTRIKPVITINGKKYAQVMIICGADNGNMNMPNYKKNLRFASHFQNSMETLYPGFTRPFLFDYRNYNQQLTTGSLLIEVGGHANTLEEAQNSASLIAYSLADVFDKQQ